MLINRSKKFLLAVFMLTATNGWCAELHGRSSTQLMFFDNEFYLGRQVELAQYLRLAVTNIDREGKLNIYGYGRASQDFTNGEGLNGRLYYLYGEYRDFNDRLDFRLGRQWVNLSAGSVILDGLQVDLRKLGPFAVTLVGGRDVIFDIDGEAGYGWNADLGLSARLEGFKNTDAEISWLRKWEKSDIARDVLGATIKQNLFNNFKLYGNARYDLSTETFNEFQGGMKFYPLSNLIFTAEYYQSYPQFDTTSIYSAFAVDRYQEGVFRGEYIFNDMISLSAGYNRQSYGEGANADVYQLGVGLRPLDQLRVNVEYDNRQGYYGSTNGIIVDALVDINRKAEIAFGINYDVYQRDILLNDEIARRYYLGGKYRFTRTVALSGRIQDDVNVRYHENISGRLVLDYDF